MLIFFLMLNNSDKELNTSSMKYINKIEYMFKQYIMQSRTSDMRHTCYSLLNSKRNISKKT